MDKKQAIEFLRTKLDEIPRLSKLSYTNEVEYHVWRDEIEDVLEEVFGRKSKEYKRLHETRTTLSYETPQSDYRKLLQKRAAIIRSIINKYEISGIEAESTPIAEPKDKAELPVYLFNNMQFQPRVIEVSRKLFKDGHYRDAILRAFIEVNNFIKEKTGLELDGKALMAQVFKTENPVIKLNELRNKTEKDEQEGFMFLFMGATVGIRNPKAHDNVIQTDPFRTLEYLSLASLLMRRVKEGAAVKTRPTKINEEIFLTRCKEGGHKIAEELYFKAEALTEKRHAKGDFINWGVSGYSYRMPRKGYPTAEALFVSYGDGGLSLWLYVIENSGIAGQRYLENLQNIGIFAKKVGDYKRHKEPYFSTDKMAKTDVDAFISAIEELGQALDAESNKMESGSGK